MSERLSQSAAAFAKGGARSVIQSSALVAAAVLLGGAASACDPCGGARVRVLDGQGLSRLDVCAEEAITEAARREGLAGRESLPAGEGLWMVFPTVGEVCITGEGMRFPLDVVFVNKEGLVAATHALGVDDPALHCEPSTANVLEVNAGEGAPSQAGDAVVVE